MPRTVLDTSVLVRYWRRKFGTHHSRITAADAARWGNELAELYDGCATVTPVYVEFVAGVSTAAELRLAQAYLQQFEILDDRTISAADWNEAARVAQRVPRDGKPRHLGDCLIRAIANRFRAGVVTHDSAFPG
jgi:predicted nucleic acid-binding protein